MCNPYEEAKRAVKTLGNVAENALRNPLPIIETAVLLEFGIPAPIASAAVSAANGGKLQDIVLAGATAYAGQQIGQAVSNVAVPGEFQTTDVQYTNEQLVKNIVASASGSAAVAALRNQPLDKVLTAATTGAISSYVSQDLINHGINPGTLDNKLITNAITSATNAVLSGKPVLDSVAQSSAAILLSSAINTGVNQLKQNSSTAQKLSEDFNAKKQEATAWFDSNLAPAQDAIQAAYNNLQNEQSQYNEIYTPNKDLLTAFNAAVNAYNGTNNGTAYFNTDTASPELLKAIGWTAVPARQVNNADGSVSYYPSYFLDSNGNQRSGGTDAQETLYNFVMANQEKVQAVANQLQPIAERISADTSSYTDIADKVKALQTQYKTDFVGPLQNISTQLENLNAESTKLATELGTNVEKYNTQVGEDLAAVIGEKAAAQVEADLQAAKDEQARIAAAQAEAERQAAAQAEADRQAAAQAKADQQSQQLQAQEQARVQAAADAQAINRGFPSADVEKKYGGNLEAYKDALAQEAANAGFPSLAVSKMYGGDLKAYAQDMADIRAAQALEKAQMEADARAEAEEVARRQAEADKQAATQAEAERQAQAQVQAQIQAQTVVPAAGIAALAPIENLTTQETPAVVQPTTQVAQESAAGLDQLVNAFTNPESTASYPGTNVADISGGITGLPTDQPTEQDYEQLGVGLPAGIESILPPLIAPAPEPAPEPTYIEAPIGYQEQPTGIESLLPQAEEPAPKITPAPEPAPEPVAVEDGTTKGIEDLIAQMTPPSFEGIDMTGGQTDTYQASNVEEPNVPTLPDTTPIEPKVTPEIPQVADDYTTAGIQDIINQLPGGTGMDNLDLSGIFDIDLTGGQDDTYQASNTEEPNVVTVTPDGGVDANGNPTYVDIAGNPVNADGTPISAAPTQVIGGNSMLDKIAAATGLSPTTLKWLGAGLGATGLASLLGQQQKAPTPTPYTGPLRNIQYNPATYTPYTYKPYAAGGIATGGIANLGGYSDGGRLLRGPGDGVSDSIPAMIGNKQPARLADGEFVIPARIVSEIGNGSTDAGARKLYEMMDRVQAARRKTTGKGKFAANTKADKYLPT